MTTDPTRASNPPNTPDAAPLPVTDSTRTAPTLSLEDIAPFRVFAAECERGKIATEHQLRWWVRFRDENGLSACGAVVERRPNPRSTRPMLFIVRPRFAAWMAGGS